MKKEKNKIKKDRFQRMKKIEELGEEARKKKRKREEYKCKNNTKKKKKKKKKRYKKKKMDETEMVIKTNKNIKKNEIVKKTNNKKDIKYKMLKTIILFCVSYSVLGNDVPNTEARNEYIEKQGNFRLQVLNS